MHVQGQTEQNQPDVADGPYCIALMRLPMLYVHSLSPQQLFPLQRVRAALFTVRRNKNLIRHSAVLVQREEREREERVWK